MKIDKEIVIGFIICGVILFGWEPFTRFMGWQSRPAAEVQQQAPVLPAANAVKPQPVQPVLPQKKITGSLPLRTVQTADKLPAVKIENGDLILSIQPVSGTAEAVTMKHFRNADRTAMIRLDQKEIRGVFSLFAPVSGVKPAGVVSSKTAGNNYTLIRRLVMSDGGLVEAEQQWMLPAAGYEINYEVKLRAVSKKAVAVRGFAVSGGDLAPWQQLSGDAIRVDSHRLDYLSVNEKFVDIKADDDDVLLKSPVSVKWAGVCNKYFACILAGKEPFELGTARTNPAKGVYVLNFSAGTGDFVLQPGEEKSFSFRCYAGPKETALLKAFEPSCTRMMHLAWGPLDYLARFLLWVLIKLKSVCGSYGWSIVILTLLVRIVFYPVTAKANVSMKKMQAVGPKIQALREKYKDNPQLLNIKTMELYRAEKVNPFGGCLPILLQIPVFFALYATLDGALELRHVSFLWATDLAGPDTVAVIPLYFFNLPINPLVLAMTLLMVIQQRMTPMSMDPAQKKMMMAMPIVMLLFLYNLPSGLTLYWTVSNFFSIIQLKLQQRSCATPGAEPAKP